MSGLQPAEPTAIRAVFMALFDAAEKFGPWNEGRWEEFVHSIDVVGRMLFDYSRLDTNEGDFWALITEAQEVIGETRDSIAKVSAELQQNIADLRNVLGEPSPEPPPPAVVATPMDATPQVTEQSTTTEPAPEPATTRRQGPRYDREAMFEVIRRSQNLRQAANDLGLQQTTLLSRLDTLQGHGELPDDILRMRPGVSASPETPAEAEARRDKAAREASARTWSERTKATGAGCERDARCYRNAGHPGPHAYTNEASA